VDGSTHIGVELIGNAIADGKFLFDAAEGFGGSDEDPQTGFIDGTIDGGVGLSLDISPDGAFIGLPASISASLDLIAESPNWIISPPLLSDPLGFEEVLNAGTAQGPGAGDNTIVLASSSTTQNDFYNGARIRITGGTDKVGEIRRITDYLGGTKIATVNTAWTTNPSSDTTYEILLDPIRFTGSNTETLATALSGGTLAENVSIVVSNNDNGNTADPDEAVGLLEAGNYGSAAGLRDALQDVVDDALKRLEDQASLAPGTLAGGITIGLDGSNQLTATGVAGMSLRANRIVLDFRGPDFDDILSQFRDFSFDDIVAALQLVVDFLDGIKDSGVAGEVFNFQIPLINRSVGDLIDAGDEFLDFVEELSDNPAGSLQILENMLRDQLNLPQLADPLGLGLSLGSNLLDNLSGIFTFGEAATKQLAQDMSFRLSKDGQDVLVELRAAETALNADLNALRVQIQDKIDAALGELGAMGTLTVSEVGGVISLTPAGDVIGNVNLSPFSLFSLDIPNGLLNLDYNFSASTEENRPFNLDLADAGLPTMFTNLIGVSTSGLLAVEANLDFNLGLGLDLLGANKGFFIRTDATSLTASASASGSNLNFSGMLGPLGLFVKGGSASLDANFSASMFDHNGNQRFNLVALGDGSLDTDLDDIGSFIVVEDLVDGPSDSDTVFLSATAEASLPLFFGLESSPKPLGDPNILGAEINLIELILGVDGDDLGDEIGYKFTKPDVNFDDLTALIPDLFGMLADPSIMIDSLNLVLKTLQDTLNGQIFGLELPLIGDLLEDNPVSNFIEDFRVDVLQPFANTLRQANVNLDGLILLIQNTFLEAFGPSGLNILKDLDGNDIFDLLDIPANFLKSDGTPTTNILEAQALQFDFDIGKTFSFSTDEIAFDLGVPAFGLSAHLRPRVNIDFNLHFGFGVDEDIGFYFVADHEVDDTPTPELSADVTVDFGTTSIEVPYNISEPDLKKVLNDLSLGNDSGGTPIEVTNVTRSTLGETVEYEITFSDDFNDLLPISVDGGPNVSISGSGSVQTIVLSSQSGTFAVAAPAQLTGSLLFLALEVSDGVDLMGDGYDTFFEALTNVNQLPHEDFSKLSLAASLDIEENSGDGKLSFPELFSQSLDETFVVDVFGAALLRAHAQVDFSTINDDVARLLPSIGTDIIVDFSISYGPDGLEVAEPNIGLANISVDLGDIIDGIAGDILKQVKKILEPTEWLIGPDGLLNFRIPLISDLAGTKVTIRNTLLPLFAPDDAPVVNKFLDVVEELFFLVDLIDDAAGDADGLILNFGDFIVTGGQDFADLYTGVFGDGIGEVVSFLKGDDDNDITNLSQLQKLDPNKIKIPSADEINLDPAAPATTKSFTSGVTGEGSFQLELFKPETIFKLLLGQPDVTLFTVELPEFGFNFFYRQSFPIVGPLAGTFGGGIGANFDFGVGMDTRGLSQFLASKNPATLINGFFINDLDPATGFDRPEITFSAEIAVGAALDLGLIKAGVEGGIAATIDFNFADLDMDGKIRFDELAANLVANDFNPIAVFDVSGLIEFFLRAYVELNLGIVTITKEFEFLRLTLFEFNIPFERPAIMASLSGDTLTLNVGSSAEQRLNGNTSDIAETVYVETSGGGVIVYSDQFNVNKEVAKISPFFGVKKIVADGGAGNDIINLIGMEDSDIVAEIKGGEGDDEITGGWGNDLLIGDGGTDTIRGGKGEDEIRGGLGNDFLFGDENNDRLFGEAGDDELDGGDNDDILDGGVGNNIYIRSAGADQYTLLNTGSTQYIDGASGSPELNLTELFGTGITLPTSFDIFLKDGSILVGSGDRLAETLHDILNDPFDFASQGAVPNFYEHQVYVADAAGFTDIVGGEFSDNFYIVDTPNAMTLNGGTGADHYFLITSDVIGDTATFTVTIDDQGEGLAEANSIEIVDPEEFGFSSNQDAIVITENTITLDAVSGTPDTITYASPEGVMNTDQLVINVRTLGMDDLITVKSTSLTVPVRVEGGAGNDKVIVGGTADGVDEIKSILQPGGNGNVGFGPLVLVGGAGTDIVVVDDSLDSSDDIGNVTAFLEAREVQPTVNGGGTVFTDDFEVGVVSGLGMRFKVQTGVVDDFDEDTVDVDPIFDPVKEQDGRIEFEGFEVLDVQLGSGGDLLTVGGGFDLLKTSGTAGQASPDMRLDNAQLPVNRLVDPERPGTIGVEETLHTYSGLTLISGNGGNDEIDVLFTQDLEQAQARGEDYKFNGVVTLPINQGDGITELPYLKLTHKQDGVKFVTSEIVDLDITLDTGSFVFEFTDPTGTDTVPGAEQSVVLPFDADATQIKNALEGMRLVGTGFVESVTGSNGNFTITFKKDLGDLPNMAVFATQLLLSGGDGRDTFNVQSIEQPTYILGGDGGIEGDEININVALGPDGTDTSQEPPDPLFVPIPAQATINGVNDLLTADGQGDGDDYVVYLFGGIAESQINLFDSGLASDGTDSAKILGTPDVDLFLMRAAVANDGLAFAALLKPELGDWGEEQKVEDVVHVERVNYTGALDSIEVFGLEGNDRFGIDWLRRG
jgi:Ca2+-binding RTX toxin-like protein